MAFFVPVIFSTLFIHLANGKKQRGANNNKVSQDCVLNLSLLGCCSSLVPLLIVAGIIIISLEDRPKFPVQNLSFWLVKQYTNSIGFYGYTILLII